MVRIAICAALLTAADAVQPRMEAQKEPEPSVEMAGFSKEAMASLNTLYLKAKLNAGDQEEADSAGFEMAGFSKDAIASIKARFEEEAEAHQEVEVATGEMGGWSAEALAQVQGSIKDHEEKQASIEIAGWSPEAFAAAQAAFNPENQAEMLLAAADRTLVEEHVPAAAEQLVAAKAHHHHHHHHSTEEQAKDKLMAGVETRAELMASAGFERSIFDVLKAEHSAIHTRVKETAKEAAKHPKPVEFTQQSIDFAKAALFAQDTEAAHDEADKRAHLEQDMLESPEYTAAMAKMHKESKAKRDAKEKERTHQD